jgi:hypothetical protein
MNIHDWHRNGLEPPFATVEQWINDQLGYLGAEDEAIYAVTVRDETDRGRLAVRVLIATDRGLFDVLWERPDDVAKRHLTSRHYRWPDVQGFHISGTTRLDAESMMRTEPQWHLEIADPAVDIEMEEGEAGLEFWSTCVREMEKAAR